MSSRIEEFTLEAVEMSCKYNAKSVKHATFYQKCVPFQALRHAVSAYNTHPCVQKRQAKDEAEKEDNYTLHTYINILN